MWRTFRYLILLGLIGAGLVWLSNHNGIVAVDWLGYRTEIQMVLLIPAFIVLFLAVIVMDRIWRWMIHMPKNIKRKRADSRREKAYHAVMEGFTAVAAGDTGTAKKLSQQAEKLFRSSHTDAAPLSLLLAAQTAQLEGDEDGAQQHYKQMLGHSSAEFLGLRGLLVSAVRRIPPKASPVHEAIEEALQLGERAYAIRPGTRWLVLTLVELYVKSGRWKRAEQMVIKARKDQIVEEVETDRLLAIIYYHRATACMEMDKPKEAMEHAEEAHKKRLAFVPATVLLVEMYTEQGQDDKALKVIERAWVHQPHPALADRYLALLQNISPEKRIKRIEKLIKQVPDHIESQLLVARSAMDAKQWSKARNHLKSALNIRETSRVCRLMAELEDKLYEQDEQSGQENLAEMWYKRAHDAGLDARWLCNACGSEHDSWQVVCGGCGGFDTIRWTAPGVGGLTDAMHALPTGAGASVLDLPAADVNAKALSARG